MIVNTRKLFIELLSTLRIEVICEVGSKDGADALCFRTALPAATIYALEANPENFRLMRANPELQQRNVNILELAATNYDGDAEFFLVGNPSTGGDDWRGMSSLHQRSGEPGPKSVARVKAVRLDSLLQDQASPGARLALWIDAEGSAFEVIEGITGISPDVHLVHVECETSPCISASQKLYPEVSALFHRLGFVELADDHPRTDRQFNALFVRATRSVRMRIAVTLLLARARVRYLAVRVLRAACPACVQRYQAIRGRRTRGFGG
jgi:FkbM family methyltransferase